MDKTTEKINELVDRVNAIEQDLRNNHEAILAVAEKLDEVLEQMKSPDNETSSSRLEAFPFRLRSFTPGFAFSSPSGLVNPIQEYDWVSGHEGVFIFYKGQWIKEDEFFAQIDQDF